MFHISQFGTHRIRKTTLEIEQRLEEWLGRFRAERTFIFGDNPKPVYELEQELKSLTRAMAQLDIHFDDSFQRDELYAYHNATERLYEALDLVQSIRERDRGSSAYTRKTQSLLRECITQVRELNQQLSHS